MPERDTVRIAALSDVHYSRASAGHLLPLFAQIAERADIMVIAGDLTDYGLADEARVLAKDLTTAVKIPIVGVLGNHDYEGDAANDVKNVLVDAGVHMLDGDAVEIQGVGFAGVKGFAGGFGRGVLGPWGEATIKHFVQEAVNEALKLETALARLGTRHRIAVLHYSPIRETVEGEPVEIHAWLGCSRLEEPLTRFAVSAVVHGHAHKGTAEGKTSTGIPVYNVAIPVLQAAFPHQPPYRLIEVPREAPTESETPHPSRRASDREPVASRVGENRS